MRLLPLPIKPRPPARPRRTPPSAAEPDDAPPRGCAWFDSSHELGQGVLVSVHEESAELAQLVPVRWWLQWELEAALQSVRR